MSHVNCLVTILPGKPHCGVREPRQTFDLFTAPLHADVFTSTAGVFKQIRHGVRRQNVSLVFDTCR